MKKVIYVFDAVFADVSKTYLLESKQSIEIEGDFNSNREAIDYFLSRRYFVTKELVYYPYERLVKVTGVKKELRDENS